MTEQRLKELPVPRPSFSPPPSRLSSHARTVSRGLAFAALAAILAAGIPSRPQEPSKKQQDLLDHPSGFLDDISSKLQPDPGTSDWLVYFKSPDVLKQAHAFFIEPVKVLLVP